MTDMQATDAAQGSSEPTRPGVTSTRRLVLLGAGAVGATTVLSACGSSNPGGNGTGSDFSGNPAPAGSKGADALGGGGNGGSGQTLAKATDVQVGGGIISAGFVITQPQQGTFKAFHSRCPHAGCNVSRIDNGQIICPCHDSRFSVKDGSVIQGPATKPLTPANIKVDGGNINTA